jgi:hypothetical protein
MSKFWRNNEQAGISFEDMQNHNSQNWTTGELHVGLAACDDPDDLRSLMKHWYHGQWGEMEVVVFEGAQLDDLGDGYTTEPCWEISRMPLAEFMAGRDE